MGLRRFWVFGFRDLGLLGLGLFKEFGFRVYFLFLVLGGGRLGVNKGV